MPKSGNRNKDRIARQKKFEKLEREREKAKKKAEKLARKAENKTEEDLPEQADSNII